MLKRYLPCILILGSTGCAGEAGRPPAYVATIAPLQGIVEPVAGEPVDVLLRPGASPHTYDPKPSDVRAASSASILFYGSDHLDGWAAGLAGGNKVSLLGLVPDSLLLPAGTTEGIDPHFWMDPMSVRGLLPQLADTLCRHAPTRCTHFRRNAGVFDTRLATLHDSLRVMTAPVRGAAVLLAHPFLGYFAKRYGLNIAGIIEEIPGSEPTPRDMKQMIDHAKSSSARAVITMPQHSSRAAEAVAAACGLPVVRLDPIGGGSDGYEDLLYFNARRLRDALSGAAPLP